MANDPSAGQAGDPAASPSSALLSPAERSRLAQCFQAGTKNLTANADYAIEMYTACVVGDPGNAVYLQAFLGVLRKKHPPKKSGGLASLFGGSKGGGLWKKVNAGQHREVIKQGVEILKANPYDSGALLAMAEACNQLSFPATRQVYLKNALDAAPADPEVNKHCAKFAAEIGEYDQAIACWVRIGNIKSMAEDAEREIARLQVEKTIAAGQGMSGRPAPSGGAKPTAAKAAAPAAEAGEKGRIAELKKAIHDSPAEIEPYLELADLLEKEATVEEAQAVLNQALSASGGDLKVREHLEDRQLRWGKQKVLAAERKAEADGSAENRATLERLRAALLKQEVEIYAARASRYPENPTWKYELAMRLKLAGSFTEAIKQFQEVLGDSRRKGVVALELGECFQKIKQYQLAMQNYVTAVEALTDREIELRKRALYRAGVLAAGLEDLDGAKKYLSMLAGLDFGYRDVAQRLDKLGSVKDKGG
jgi:tetratricopeptide (TPR) repeat protein